MHRRTKIVATIGPASDSVEMLQQLIEAGVNIMRLNFSHGDAAQHRQTAENIRLAAKNTKQYVAILGDLQGPKIRLGELKQEIPLKQNDAIILSRNCQAGDKKIPVDYASLPECVEPGDTLLIDDGLVRLTVNHVDGDDVHCQAQGAAVLKSRKGLNRLGGGLSAPAMTEKDFKDLTLAIDLQLDYVAVSFPSCAEDLEPVREALEQTGSQMKIVAKIERAEAVDNEQVLTELILAADAVMVARGDLGVEIGDPQLIAVQKQIISLARRNNRPVITATQMMESMRHQPVPTRAEVFDVANAVLDKTDAVMLSAETAMGQFPVETVTAMANACLGAEKHPTAQTSSYRMNRRFDLIEETIAMAAMYAANHLNKISAIICLTESGDTALYLSRLSSSLPIYAVSRHVNSCRRSALFRGVIPLYNDVNKERVNGESIYQRALNVVARTGSLEIGQRVVITCGDIETEGGTNTLKILEYKGTPESTYTNQE